MITHAFAVYDKDTGTYGVPFFQPHIALAIRAFKAAANDPNSMISRNPESFELRHLGNFNDQTGALLSDTPETVATGLAAVEPSNQMTIPFKKETA